MGYRLMTASLLSCILQIAGYASTGWYRIKVEKVNIDFGLYKVVVCVYGVCGQSGYADLKNINSYQALIDWLTEYRLMASLALVADIIVTLIILMHLIQSRSRRFPASFKCQLGAVIFMDLASGGLNIVCAAKVGAEIVQHKNLMELAAIEIVEFPFPYSLLILGLGGIVSIFVSVATLLLLISELKAHRVMTTSPPTLEMQQIGLPAMGRQQADAIVYNFPINYNTGQASRQQMQNMTGYIPPKDSYKGPHPNAQAPAPIPYK